MDEAHELTGKIIGCAMKVHRALGPGFLESVYQNALLHELAKAGLRAEQKQELQVRYDGIVVGNFETDVLVESTVLLELKSVERLAKIHGVQLVNYLTATELDVGLLINFGGESLEFKRKYRLRKPNPENPVNPVQMSVTLPALS
jgi:GxxExxY protein